jgi:hypothetical protein
MVLSRRSVLRGIGVGIGTIGFASLANATDSTGRFLVDVGERVSSIDVAAIEDAGVRVTRRVDPIGYVAVEGSKQDVEKLDYGKFEAKAPPFP